LDEERAKTPPKVESEIAEEDLYKRPDEFEYQGFDLNNDNY
jgi:hypothetical protein